MRYDCHKLKRFVADVMETCGVTKEDAVCFADSLVNANMRGINSHGVTRLKTYYRRMKDGLVKANASPIVLKDMPSFLIIDADNGLGVPVTTWAMKQCIDRAKTTGACFAAIKGGNHFGYAGYFCELANAEGMIGISMTNGPGMVVPFGGKVGRLGTNPVAVSVPRVGEPPVMVDMATSVVARGKVALAKKEGRSIPLGWSMDAEGQETTDPSRAKYMMPLGGYKGYALSVMIEILVSCIAGAKTSMTLGEFYDLSGKTHQELGYFIGAINLKDAVDLVAFTQRVDALVQDLKSCPRADGYEEIFVPEEIEYRNAAKAEAEGIEISDAVIAELSEVGRESGISFDCEKKAQG